MTPFEQLQTDFPIFQIKNKRNYTQSVTTVDGETIDIPPFSTQAVRSAELTQVPDIMALTMVVPSLKDMMLRGMFDTTPATPEPTPTDANTSETE